MFECIEADTYEWAKVDNCYVGSLKQKAEFAKGYSREGASVIQAPSIGAFLDYLDKHCPEPKHTKSSSSQGRESNFHQFESYEEAMDVFRNRPHDVRKFKPEDERLAMPDESGNEVYYEVTGDYIDIVRAIEDVPESFGNFSMGNPRSMFCTIVVNLSAVWYTPVASMNRRGERLLRLVDWLEHQKIRVQVKLLDSSECMYAEIQAKEFDQYMDLDNLAVAVSPDFFRRCLFRFMEYSPTWQSGYGTSCTIESGRLSFPKRLNEQSGLFLFSENYAELEKVDPAFDMVHKTISEKLLDGQRNISLVF